MNEDEGGREGGRASMLPCFHWPRFPPDTSASSAVATGDQAAARRPVHQRVHCDRASPHSPTPLSLSLSSKLYAKLQCIKAEIQDVNDEHVRSRQELEQIQNELTRELKFK